MSPESLIANRGQYRWVWGRCQNNWRSDIGRWKFRYCYKVRREVHWELEWDVWFKKDGESWKCRYWGLLTSWFGL